MITIKEIAKELNISPSTVSIVLSGKAASRRISEATQKAVLKFAAEHGYQPNIAARNLKENSRTNQLQIAVLCASDFRTSMFARIMTGLYRYIDQQNLQVQISIHPYQTGNLIRAHALYSRSDCHAAIICNASSEDVACLEQNPPIIPIVIYNHSSDVFSGAVMNHKQIGELAANALADNNGKQAIVITSQSKQSEIDIRLNSFRYQCSKRKIDIVGIYPCTGFPADSRDVMYSLLHHYTHDQLPDSIFCDSSMTARGVLRALWESHIPVPEKVRVIAVGNGIDDDDACMIPSLSTIHISIEDVATANLQILLEILKGHTPSSHTIFFPAKYCPRETCGPLRI